MKAGKVRRLLNFLGVETLADGKWHFRLRKRLFWLFVAAVGVSLISLAGLSAYSTSPSFCNSCHIMDPYYKAWENSKHSHVSCVDCHYPPGSAKTILWKKFQALSQVAKYVTRTYSSKPFAEVEDASCLRSGCHSTRLLRGKVLTEKGVTFDHRPHLEGVRYGRQLRCVSCHSQIVVGKHIEVTWDTCYLCHMDGEHKKEGDHEMLVGCDSCHEMPSKEVKVGNITYNHGDFLGKHKVACQSCHMDNTAGQGGAVDKDRCLTCHNEMDKIERFGETDFIHNNHVTEHNVACFHCHREIKHGVTAAGTKSLDYNCAMCHTDAHDLERNMYRGVGAKGVAAMPSPMYLANVDCIGCHLEKKTDDEGVSHASTMVGSEKGCRDCHGPEYLGVLPEAQGLVNETVEALKANLATAQQGLSSAEEEGREVPQPIRDAIADAAHNLAFVERSHSVHNIYYAAHVLREADRHLKKAARTLKVKARKLSELSLINGGFCGTLCHEKVGVKVPPEKVTYEGKEMPHQEHLEEGLTCVSCHTFGTHKEVKLTNTKRCKLCHDDEEEDDDE